MSHYAVAVFHKEGQNISELLAPYDEKLKVEPYIRYTRQEAIDAIRKVFDVTGKTDEECWKMMAGTAKTDEQGNIYTTKNPKAKWDCWEVGGRFRGQLMCPGKSMKHEKYINSGKLKDVRFLFDEEAYKEELRFWDVMIDHTKKEEDNDIFFLLYSEEEYRKYYGNRETYAKDEAQFIPYACITPDGEWHSQGDGDLLCDPMEKERKWRATFFERFVKHMDGDIYVTIVDCHI